MYRLHYAPDNASLVIRLALSELDRPFATVLVDRRRAEQSSPAYRALNPVGLIPTLETPRGPIFETAAILLWLSERHDALAPRPGDRERGAFLKWLFFTSNSLHADLRMIFYPDQYVGPDLASQQALHARMTHRVLRHFDLLDQIARTDQPWFAGIRCSVLDLYVVVIARWAALYAKHGTGWFDITAFAGLERLAKRMETRRSVIAAQEAEGLGPTPFSRPQPCRAPEGCSTA